MGTKEKKSTIKFQKNKLKGVVKKRKETNKFKKQIQRRQIRRGAPIDPHKGKKTFLCNLTQFIKHSLLDDEKPKEEAPVDKYAQHFC